MKEETATPLPKTPEKIYLQIGFTPDEYDDFKKLVEVGWCSRRIFDSDIEYILVVKMQEKEAEVKELREALQELVKLKNHKDTIGKDLYYEREQPKAWHKAKSILNKHSK